MSAFRDSKHAAEVLGGFFRQQAEKGDSVFGGSGAIIAYTLKEPVLRIVLDASKPPQPQAAFGVYVDDPKAPEPQIELFMRADTFDKLFSGEMKPMELMASGHAKAKGDLAVSMRMLPAMARDIPHYKKYRETH